jgi:hypothetical protein
MLIYVKIIKKNSKNFFLIYVDFKFIYANLCKYHIQTDRRTNISKL